MVSVDYDYDDDYDQGREDSVVILGESAVISGEAAEFGVKLMPTVPSVVTPLAPCAKAWV